MLLIVTPPAETVGVFFDTAMQGSHASLHEGGGFAEGEDGGSVVPGNVHSPSQKSKIFASPLKEGAKASAVIIPICECGGIPAQKTARQRILCRAERVCS